MSNYHCFIGWILSLRSSVNYLYFYSPAWFLISKFGGMSLLCGATQRVMWETF